MDAYLEKERSDSSGNVDLHTVLCLHPQLAPVKVAVLPQIQQQSELCDVAHQLSSELREAGGLSLKIGHFHGDFIYYNYQNPFEQFFSFLLQIRGILM